MALSTVCYRPGRLGLERKSSALSSRYVGEHGVHGLSRTGLIGGVHRGFSLPRYTNTSRKTRAYYRHADTEPQVRGRLVLNRQCDAADRSRKVRLVKRLSASLPREELIDGTAICN